MSTVYVEITKDDLPELTRVMTRAFDHECQNFLGQEKGGPDGYDNGDFFRTWLFPYEQSKGFKIVRDGQLMGAYIIWILDEGKNILGTIFIDPDYQNQAIGAQAWQHIEDTYPETRSWTLETPSWSIRNHYFYETKCGFSKIGEKETPDHEGSSYVYRKVMRSD